MPRQLTPDEVTALVRQANAECRDWVTRDIVRQLADDIDRHRAANDSLAQTCRVFLRLLRGWQRLFRTSPAGRTRRDITEAVATMVRETGAAIVAENARVQADPALSDD